MKFKTRHILFCFILILLFSPSNSLRGQDSLNKYLELAAGNNPKIKAAFNRYLAAMEKIPQAGALPDPQVSFGYFIKPMQIIGGNQVADIQLMQMFPWFGTLKAGKDEASLMAKVKYEEFNSSKAELFYKVKSSWYQLMKYDREILLVQENLEMFESIEKVALMKFQSPVSDGPSQAMKSSGSQTSGMPPTQTGLQDVLRVKMEILDQNNKLESLNDQRDTEAKVFNSLLNRKLEIPVLISDSLYTLPLPAARSALPDSILKNNTTLKMLENETGSYSFMEQKAKKKGLPMVGIGLDYMLISERDGNTSMMNGKDMIMPMVSLSIPIYRKKYNAMQNEARLMRESGNQQIADLRNSLLVQYSQIIQRLDDSERRIALFSEQEDLARKTTGLLLSGFTTTGRSFEEVLRMQLKVLDYGFRKVEAIVDYNTSVARVEFLINSIRY